jgi:Holliday junction resolvasome RuvABC endonuclease subunit
MKGISIDPNTHDTGLVIWSGSEPISWWVLGGRSAEEMAGHIVTQIIRLAPDWIAIEGAYLGENPNTYGQLMMLIGATVGTARHLGIPCRVISAAEISDRLNLPVKGRKAANMRLAEMVRPAWRLTQDTADALAVGLAVVHEFVQTSMEHTG